MGHEPTGTAAVSAVFSGAEQLNRVIDEIEKHLTDTPDCATLARICALSEYEFRRVFSFFVGVSVAEYIRKRRLSLAAAELKAGEGDIAAVGQKYGYPIPSSFTRAFREQFGITPSEASDPTVRLSLYTRPGFEWCVRGGEEISYTLVREDAFSIEGVTGTSDLSDTVCCESVWRMWETEEQTGGDIYAAYFNGESNVLCKIGHRVTGEDIPASLWAVFALPEGEREVNDLYTDILCRFLPSSGYRRREGLPNLEIFPEDGGEGSIYIPIEEEA